MSVATQLGLESPEADLLQTAHQRWPEWAARYPALDGAPSVAGLRAWMVGLDPGPRNEVVCALGRLGSRDGEDDVAAAAVLAWALVPGAARLAQSLRRFSPVIDELVAAQLWLEVRTLPARATRKVAANLLSRVRVAIRRDLGLTAVRDQAWSRCVLLDPLEPGWQRLPAAPVEVPARHTLHAVLERAVSDRVITAADCRLLVHLAAESRKGDCTRSRSGLVTRRAGQVVAAEVNLSDRQVRRRAARALDALAGAYANGVPA